MNNPIPKTIVPIRLRKRIPRWSMLHVNAIKPVEGDISNKSQFIS